MKVKNDDAVVFVQTNVKLDPPHGLYYRPVGFINYRLTDEAGTPEGKHVFINHETLFRKSERRSRTEGHILLESESGMVLSCTPEHLEKYYIDVTAEEFAKCPDDPYITLSRVPPIPAKDERRKKHGIHLRDCIHHPGH